MKNKIISTIILILSIILIIKSISPLKIYNHIKKGNSFVKEEKYSNGRNEYESALTLKEDKNIRENILKTFYGEKNYEEVVKSNVKNGFLKGNSYVYLSDNSPEKSREFYEKALEEYKLAMKNSNDINIKKNYELTLKKLENMNKQQNQDNKDKNQNSNSQENSNQNKNNKEQNSSQQDKQESNDNNNSQNNQENQQENNQSSNREQDEQKNNSQDKQNDGDSNQQNNSQENISQPQKNTTNNSFQQGDETNQEDIRKQEIRAILKRLEGNEKQSFKNNERVMNINSNNPSNRW